MEWRGDFFLWFLLLFIVFFRGWFMYFFPEFPVYGIAEGVENPQDKTEEYDNHNRNVLKFPEKKIYGSFIAHVKNDYSRKNKKKDNI